MRPALPSPPPPPRNDRESDYLHFHQMDSTTEWHKYVVDYLISHHVIKKARRSFIISPYRHFYIESRWYSAKMDRAYLIEDENKKLVVATLLTSATLHYDGLNEVLMSNWESNDDKIGETLLFSPSSTFEPLRGIYPTSGFALVNWQSLSNQMPWFDKVNKLSDSIKSAMYSLNEMYGTNLSAYHRSAIATTYSLKFGQYYNGFNQSMDPVISSGGMDANCMTVYPEKITVNPTQFILYTNALGDQPKITLYKQYAKYMFAHSKKLVYKQTDFLGQPIGNVYSDTEPLVIDKYNPDVFIWSYEEFESRCAKLSEHDDPKTEKEVKAFIERIAVERNSLNMCTEINKFADHCCV
jgi:hypothetical protein